MYEYEENSEIIGAHCTLLTPYKGYSEGTVVGDFGNKKWCVLVVAKRWSSIVMK